MKALLLTLSTLFIIVRDTIAQEDGYHLYSRRYERLDIDTILASPRLVTNYVDCLLSKKPCPPEGKALKRILPEALRTKCGRCWPQQKEGALKVITALYNDYPQHYLALRERWDPTGEYHRRFEEYLRDQKFNVINSNGGQDGIDQAVSSQEIQQSITKTTILTTTTTTTIKPKINTSSHSISASSEEPISEATSGVEVSNRFDASNEDDGENKVPIRQRPPKTTTTQSPRTHRTTPSIRTSTSRPTKRVQRIPQTLGFSSTTPRPLTGFVTHTTFNTNNPILNIINHLTLKVANTAELLTGMLHGAATQKKIITISTPIFTIEKRYGPR